jgi:hypothetical protein
MNSMLRERSCFSICVEADARYGMGRAAVRAKPQQFIVLEEAPINFLAQSLLRSTRGMKAGAEVMKGFRPLVTRHCGAASFRLQNTRGIRRRGRSLSNRRH